MSLARKIWLGLLASFATMTVVSMPAAAQQQPNIIMIMGDDIGIWNTGAYHRGLMAGRTPISTNSPRRACCSPTTTPRRAARRDALAER